ncbi:MAG: hypothetical protein V1706_12960 [Pseudomonadota bacterium]
MPKMKKSSGSKTIFFLVLFILASLSLFFFLKTNKNTAKNGSISLEQEQQKWQDKVNVFEKESAPPGIDRSAHEIIENPSDQVPVTDEAPTSQNTESPQPIDPCKETEDGINQFFTHLDEQEYITDFQLEEGSKAFFSQTIDTLLKTPPKITRETDNLLSILQNAAHFYRVLGDKNLFILKKIMAHEKIYYEPLLADFYYLIAHENDCRHIDSSIKLPLKEIYGYSVYFLNTLGGQAYLFRREITLRTLVKYYCILVIDLANEKNINTLGIDIRYPVNILIDEMSFVTGIDSKEKYLANLRLLRNKYEKKYGAL